MPYILGISCEHDAGAAILTEDGQIVAAANEERFTRKKLFVGIPEQAISALLNSCNINPTQIKRIVVSSFLHSCEKNWNWDQKSFLRTSVSKALELPIMREIMASDFAIKAMVCLARDYRFRFRLRQTLKALGLNSQIKFFDHHLCHVSSAIHTSGFEEGLAVSYDANGDGYSSRVYEFSDYGRKKYQVFANVFFRSMAHYYGYATKIAGFRQMEHEGKITGLAARGNYKKCFEIFESRLFFDSEAGKFVSNGGYIDSEIKYLKEALVSYSREDIAAGIQHHLEINMIKFFEYLHKKTGKRNFTIAGGTFANVLLNQKLSELYFVEQIHVHPHMGDGGLAFGAAAEEASQLPEYKNSQLKHVFLGPVADERDLKLSEKFGLKLMADSEVAYKAATMLAQKGIGGIVEGRMEYGPRALCHRSVIANPQDLSIHDELNQMLGREEFMPFAPIILAEDVGGYFENIDNKSFMMEFMTTTVKTTQLFREHAAVANHVDNTARPQLVFPETGEIYSILKCFKEITGSGVLINTSFNTHGEPILFSYLDAFRSCKRVGLDFLVLDGRLFVNSGGKRQINGSN